MTFSKDFKDNIQTFPSDRLLTIVSSTFCIALDFYCKFIPEAPLIHLLYGTTPTLELIVIGALLINTPILRKVAYWTCVLDVIIGFIGLLTLPVISVAENATGIHLNLPFVSTFHTDFKIQVYTRLEFLYVTILLGFVSTLLISVFLAVDLLKFYWLRRICRQDNELAEKQKQAEQRV